MKKILIAVLISLTLAPAASARPRVPGPVFKAVRAEWHTRAERVQAFTIIACETGDTYSTTIPNGKRFGLFQFGPWEIERFGYGDTPREQARGAHNYYRTSGWSPWLNFEPAGCGA